ncbi:MAG TPA: hypothetical protein VK745_16300, partial [Polyangiaceae bacterium]|nr:hypothetical protein [Polyangiaceae bacterium]
AIWVRSVTFEGGSDYWEHSATLHALMQKPWHPSNPHLVSLAPSSRFGPQFLLIALVARGLHLNVLGAMSLSAVANTLLFVLGIRVFFSTYFRHPLAPLYGLLVMLTGWWHGFHYSNVYQLHVLFTVASYPSTTALGLSLLGFALAVRLLRAELARPKVALAVLLLWTAAVFIIHPLTAMLTLSGTGLLAICVPKAGLRVRLELIATLVAGLIFARFWPYFSPWEVVRGGHGAAAGWAGDSLNQMADLHVKRTLHEFYHADGLIAALGMALLALLALPYFLIRRERWFVGFGALSMLLPFVVNVFVDLPLGHRFVLLAIVYLHIGVVWLLLKLTPSYEHAWPLFDRPWSKVAAACGIAALLVVFAVHSALLARDTLRNPKFYSRPESPVVSNMKAFADAAGQNAVVLASPLLSWPLPTFGPKVLVLYHYDPLVSDQTEREFYVARFLGRSTDEQRAQILAHYGVTHVLLSRESSSGLLRFLDQHSTVRRVGTGYRLYTLDPSAKTL